MEIEESVKLIGNEAVPVTDTVTAPLCDVSAKVFSVGILAGGKSLRMGQDKALLSIGNERFIDRITGEFKDFHEVIISAAKPGMYDDLGLPVVLDENKGIGPIEGIRQVLLAAGKEYVFICAADMPFIKKELALYLAGYISADHDCYVTVHEDHTEPLCAIYSKRALPVIEELIKEGRYRIREIFHRLNARYIEPDPAVFDMKMLKNINTPDEFLSEIPSLS